VNTERVHPEVIAKDRILRKCQKGEGVAGMLLTLTVICPLRKCQFTCFRTRPHLGPSPKPSLPQKRRHTAMCSLIHFLFFRSPSSSLASLKLG
jgi:hypothetical protein